MNKYLVIAAGALAILSASTLPFDSAQAGGSSSAPSKYVNEHHAASANQGNRQARTTDFRITEYSSSSARNPSQRH
jgi:hypothetical protein